MKKILSSILVVLLVAAMTVPAYAERIPHGGVEGGGLPGMVPGTAEGPNGGLPERTGGAGDDAEGLPESEKMHGQISGRDEASTAGQDGISMVREDDGMEEKINSLLEEMKDLAQQTEDLETAGKNLQELTDEVNRIIDEEQTREGIGRQEIPEIRENID